MNTVVITIISLSVIGAFSGFILYLIAQQFKVFEDPRIDDVEGVLPGANCGGCGYPGCRGFAETCVKAESLDVLFCPVGGNDGMAKVAAALGKQAVAQDPRVAVVRCSGSPDHRVRTARYDGVSSCEIASALYCGDTGCSYGCLGLGDCVVSCTFDAIRMNPVTMLPEVIDEKCTSCGACVKACPKMIIELRKKAKKDRKIFVSCVNRDKGAVAKKACSVACIACKACVKACEFDAITIENMVAYIDPVKCTFCRKCIPVCPTDSIIEFNFPPRKVKEAEAAVSESIEK
jgi:Na+-translocating ferredoxin:NAD+ oxidoreductase RNF subunit RnfB